MATPQDFLRQLRIASPCPASWADMAGDDRVRFCAQCEKQVYDLSKMTAAEGLALIRETEGEVCGRLWRRADGSVITADCPVGARTLRARRKARLPLAAAALIALSLSDLACAPKVKPQAAPAPPTPRTQAAMTVTYGYSDGVPAAEVMIFDSARPPGTAEMGALIGLALRPELDLDAPGQGMRISHEAWENLPIR